MAKELRLVIDVALCLRAWKKVARRQRQKREKAALSAPPPLDEPQSPPPPSAAPPPSVPAAQPTVLCEAVSDCVLPAELSPPPPVEPPPPTPPQWPPLAPVTDGQLWEIVRGGEHCQMINNGTCVTDGTGTYGNNERCTIRAEVDIFATAPYYAVETCWDYLTFGTTQYRGQDNAPFNVFMAAGTTATTTARRARRTVYPPARS